MKKYIGILILSLYAFTLDAQNLNDSLLLYYPFNSNSNDSSDNGFHGTVFYALPTIGYGGNLESAFYFNGVSSHVDFPNQQQLKPQLPITIAFYVKYHNLVGTNNQIFTTDFTENTYFGVWFGLDHTTHQMAISFGEGTMGCTGPNCRRSKTGTTVFEAGIWYFVVGVIRGAGDMSIYINCKDDEGTYSGTGSNIAYSSNLGSIGKTDVSDSNPFYFKGSLDEFRYWNRALNDTDVNKLCGVYLSKDFTSNTKYSISIHPNPVSDILFIDSEIINSNAIYIIQNIYGQTLLRGQLLPEKNNSIEISFLIPGIYFLTTNIKGQFTKFKFIKI
ncbi:MAG: hypothetical protein A2275_13550 [Bacteroidetes bacterium RIFOXYA12_FULL_35_11]|nr:MAG: hypothetical protein A2X01_20305 [Bacteroidetes bacterium GWF2_35_48]OFY82542.1 MAG: hypothetical protein A2275_13550 [Bacteroidetes bacterium RIFOXYA12_FULL_35_11]OFY93553.1 MAG: hypothetical protein A2491_09310 [Bacteroidetes bacterium RIFOXYC12_FULL_35_7]OFY94488.1 MAG: hypothetical protein A2309_08790 [Bacteroidetes bacterium RIFOXYB2_FULL_35_7]HBX51158.1 hypothetical protein [Bacteroidales bacterium]